MLVSISGPPMSGKTTLHNALAHRCPPNLPTTFSPDLVRESINDLGVKFVEQDRRAFQEYVGFAQYLAERRMPMGQVGILDKSLIDAVAYWDVFVGGKRPIWASKVQGAYDLVFLCAHREIQVRGSAVDVMHAAYRDQ